MAVSAEEVASLFAGLGLQIDKAQWAAGNSAVTGMQQKMAGLQAQGAQFSGGKWRQANGQFLTTTQRQAMGLRNVGEEAAKTKSQLDGVWKLAAMGAAVVGIEHVYHSLIGFNEEVQNSKISLSAMLSGQLDQDWKTAQSNASALYDEFQRFSQVTPVTTQQIFEFGKGIAAATFQAGGGVEELKNLTEQGVIAAKVLAGDRGAGYAQLELTEMLSGVINKRMIFARQLLGMGKMTEEAFKALDGKGRIAALQKILNSDAMNNARDAFGASFTGVTSTMWDKMQIAFAKVGAPLFEEITKKVTELNKWMDRNKVTIESYARAIGGRLVTAFNIAAAAIGFVTEHATFFEGVLIGIGAFITAFAIQAAIDWAIAFWPITLGIAAIAALHAALQWFTDDVDETTDSLNELGNTNLDKITGALDNIRSGKAIDQIRGVSPGNLGDKTATRNQVWKAPGSDRPSWMLPGLNPNQSSDFVDDASGPRAPLVPIPERPRATLAPTPLVTVRPQVNVKVSGNMPEGWIDTKIQTAIDDHHETTWNNAAHALQADDDE